MNFGKMLAGNIAFRSLNIVAGVLVTVLLTRLMSTGGYGVFSLLVVNATIFSLISCLGSESGITYQFASGGLKPGKIFSIIYIIILFQLGVLILTELIHFNITGTYWMTGGKELKFLVWGLIYLFSISLIDKYTAFLNGNHLYILANKIIFFSNIITLTMLGCLYFFYELQDTFFYLQAIIATTCLQAFLLLTFFHIFSKQPLRFSSIEKKDWKLFFTYSFVVFITNLIQFLAYRVDYWLVNHYKGIDALGLYSLSVKLGQLFWVFPILFASIIFPRVADKQMKYDVSKFLTLLRISNSFIFFAMLPAALLAGWFIPFLFGAGFNGSIQPFIILLPGLLMFSVNIMLAAWFAGRDLLRVNLIGSTICFLLVLLLDLWLIPLKGITGAAMATSIAYSLSALYSIWKFSGIENRSIRSIIIFQANDWLSVKEVYKKLFR